MKYSSRSLALVLILVAGWVFAREARPPEVHPAAATDAGVSVWFSPDGGCTEAVVHELEQARTSVLVQAYSFTSPSIAKALADAQARGVKVTVILDKSQQTEQYSSATFLANHQVPTFIDAKHAIAHNKIMLIDGATVITGSFNFTKAAEEKNAENLLVIRDRPALVKAYEVNFRAHLEHSEKYSPSEPRP